MNEDKFFPDGTEIAVRIEKLIKQNTKKLLGEKMSSRMVKCASVLGPGAYLGWQMAVPAKGLVEISLFGSKDVQRSDLIWIAEKTGSVRKGRVKTIRGDHKSLYEIYLPVAEGSRSVAAIGFGADCLHRCEANAAKWPACFSVQFEEFLRALQGSGGIMRIAVGPADEETQQACRKNTIQTYDVFGVNVNDYIGRPVKARVFLRLPESPSIRLRTVIEESVRGAKVRFLGNTDQSETMALWDNPLQDAAVLPDYAARIMIMEPELRNNVIGIGTCEEKMKILPADHNTSSKKDAVYIGRAVDTSGINRRIRIGTTDLKRHYQIVGQTGSGKSTLLMTVVLSAARQGHGLTLFDPHGNTVDTVLRCLPEKYVDRVRVVRIGDADNPVPLNIWDSDDPEKEERNISDLCELFRDIFDPKQDGIVGPRYERWLSTFAKASIACLGRRASLESIAVLSQSQENMLKVYKAIRNRYPELAERIKQEYGLDNSSDFHSILGWYLCKFERLTSVEQLRKTLGAGTNALDFDNTLDSDTITLIDLAEPEIGTNAARIIGTLMMMKLWNAAMKRRERDRLHLVVVDEASLFQTNPMPRMLAESRKFGLSLVLCHQHTGQLSREIRDALEANAANFSALRLSSSDAAAASSRFGETDIRNHLTRLDAFHAVTTISVNGRQTAPFTLKIDRPRKQKNAEDIAERIERNSIARLVDPYRHLRALTPAEIISCIEPSKAMNDKKDMFGTKKGA